MTELLAEASYTRGKHPVILNVEELYQNKELAKLKVKAQVFDEINKDDYPVNFTKQLRLKLKNKKKKIRQKCMRQQRKICQEKIKTEKCIKSLDPIVPLFQKKVEKMYGLLKGMIGQEEAPSIEMKIFDGNTLEYHQFLYFFREVLKKRIQQPQREDI